MIRYVALLRAINVGGRRVKMDHLRVLFEALGFASVETFIASGNVLFGSLTEDTKDIPSLEQQIERHLHEALGYEVATFIRSAAELDAIARYEPFPMTEEGTLSVAFLATEPPEEAVRKLMALRTETDDLHVHQREVYWLRRPLAGVPNAYGVPLEKILGMAATVRNMTTVQKLAAKSK